MPLHQIMGNFDSNSSFPSEIDALLLKGCKRNESLPYMFNKESKKDLIL